MVALFFNNVLPTNIGGDVFRINDAARYTDSKTLSSAVISSTLREELNYDGVVISDDLQMGAITDHYGFETAIKKSIDAGVDIIAFANNSVYEEDVTARAIEVIRDLVQAGALGEARIDASYQRIQHLKSRLLSG